MYDSLPQTINVEQIEEMSQIFKILSHPTRLAILFLLHEQACSVKTITQALDLEQSAVSHQLNSLKQVRLVKSQRKGKNMVYSLDDSHVFEVLQQALKHVQE